MQTSIDSFATRPALADAVAKQWIEKLGIAAERIAAQEGSSATRLTRVVLELYRIKKREYLRSRPVHELFLVAEINGLSCVDAYQKRINDIFAGIIQDGITAGEFRRLDVASVAPAIHASLAKYFHPVLVEQFQDENGEEEISVLLDLITSGMARNS